VAASRAEGDPVPVAFVRPADGTELDETALRARCLEKLARFKVPERVVVVEAFPIVDSPNGPKVQRVRLREMAELLLREQRHNQLRDVPIGLSQS
jgi:fatty-acyl-CoA synthase